MSKSVKIFVNRLRKQINSGAISKSKLNKDSTVARPSIDGYLSGKLKPSLESAEQIANALGYSLSDFISEKPNSVHTLDDCLDVVNRAAKRGSK